MTARTGFLLAIAAALIAAGCSDNGDDSSPTGGGGGGGSAPTAEFSAFVQPLISNRCAVPGCHGAGSNSGGYSFGSNPSHSTVVNASGDHGAIVVPGDASSSNLYLKTTSSPPFGSRMPFGGPFLSTDEQNALRDWINAGAPDN
jgi:hypothetical protein